MADCRPIIRENEELQRRVAALEVELRAVRGTIDTYRRAAELSRESAERAWKIAAAGGMHTTTRRSNYGPETNDVAS